MLLRERSPLDKARRQTSGQPEVAIERGAGALCGLDRHQRAGTVIAGIALSSDPASALR
jgi:hypothetical protein